MKKILIISLVLNVVLICGFSAYATIYYEASQINYKNTRLDLALDDLYATSEKEIEFVGTYQGSTWAQRYQPASVTINNLEAGEYMAVGFRTFSEGGYNQNHLYFFYDISEITNATYEYIGDNKTVFKLMVPEINDVSITFPKAFDSGTNVGGYAYVWLFK